MKITAALALAIALIAVPAAAGTSSVSPRTTNNDDSCDIAVLPAATLLVPYFEVDFSAGQSGAATTLFTVQNVSAVPQIAHVTLWTDWGYPVISFPMFLSGYDVQAINLYDVLVANRIAPPSGTSNESPLPANNPAGARPDANASNPNFGPTAAFDCAQGVVPQSIPSSMLVDVRTLLTTGRGGNSISCPSGASQAQVGSNHGAKAIGYLTIDVVSTCWNDVPTSTGYFSHVILFDNVLVGDYQQVVPRGATSYAQGGPMVHIRAIPEGGAIGSQPATNLPYTFYDRLTKNEPSRTFDRRQPLPSTFAARYIQGGTGGFNTQLKIWREALTSGDAACNTYVTNGNMTIAEQFRFDEHENAVTLPSKTVLQAASLLPTTSSVFPPVPSAAGDVAGWMYLNLNNGGSTAYSAATGRDFRTGTTTSVGPRQSQGWVITTLFAEPTYAVEMTAPALGNGCSPAPATASTTRPVGPAANATP
ncbi:MAG: hypothetical protein QOI24_3619 [Acidobacteriota bacterium]|nr:hypothetical protein [Acidobacteriota bacterium]